jgi:hypothetical protein
MQFFQQKVAEHFDYYFEFINDKSQKKVNELLGAATRVNELLRKDTARTSKKDIYGSPDFLIIKMLRNHNEHNGQVSGEFKMLDSFATDQLRPPLGFFCLVPLVKYNAAKNPPSVSLGDIKKMDSSRSIIGDYIDIHTSIFNLSVYVYELLVRMGLSLDTKC